MKGTRKDNPNSQIPNIGEYGRDNNGEWFGRTPTGLMANLSGHMVLEWPDGTISVTPSILVTTHDGEIWHGFLTEGRWDECGQPWKNPLDAARSASGGAQ